MKHTNNKNKGETERPTPELSNETLWLKLHFFISFYGQLFSGKQESNYRISKKCLWFSANRQTKGLRPQKSLQKWHLKQKCLLRLSESLEEQRGGWHIKISQKMPLFWFKSSEYEHGYTRCGGELKKHSCTCALYNKNSKNVYCNNKVKKQDIELSEKNWITQLWTQNHSR